MERERERERERTGERERQWGAGWAKHQCQGICASEKEKIHFDHLSEWHVLVLRLPEKSFRRICHLPREERERERERPGYEPLDMSHTSCLKCAFEREFRQQKARGSSIISSLFIKWIRTSWLSIKNSPSPDQPQGSAPTWMVRVTHAVTTWGS